MRFWKRMLIAALCLVSVLFVGSKIAAAHSGRKEGPVISCSQEVLEISVEQPQEVLLTGMSASDKQDGDLTDRIRISGVSKLITQDTAKVTYLVFDSDNNLATYTRTIRYLDYQRPVLEVTGPLLFTQGEASSVVNCLRATDRIDGDLSDQIRLSTLRTTEYSNIYAVTAQVTNSMGNTAKLELPVVVMQSDANRPKILLREYLTYLQQGDSFDPGDYVKAVTVNRKSISVSEVSWDNPVNPNVPGTYWVIYHCNYESSTGYIVQTVVVEAEGGAENE